MKRFLELKQRYKTQIEKNKNLAANRQGSHQRKMTDSDSETAGRSFGGQYNYKEGMENDYNSGTSQNDNCPCNEDDEEWDAGGANDMEGAKRDGNDNDEEENGRGSGGFGGRRSDSGRYDKQKGKQYENGRNGGRYNNERGGGDRYNNERSGGDRYNNQRSGGDRYNNERGGGDRYNNERGGGDRYNNERDGGDRYNRNGGDRYRGNDRGSGGDRYKRNDDGGGGDRYQRKNENNYDDRKGKRYENEDGEAGGHRRSEFNNNDGERKRNNDEGGEQKPREFYIPPEPTSDEEEMFKTGISSGINFDKYDKIPIKVSGNDPPEQINNFEEAGLRDFVVENIRKSGYSKPTPIQKTAIPIIMAGRDLMACAQTGSGKTAAFLLPIINQLLVESRDMAIGKPHAVVVSPTRELSIQIYNEARKFAMGSYLKVAIVYGGTSSKHQSEKVAKGCHVLICTPGRLLDFVDRDFVRFEDTRFVVLDEADRMLDMGFLESMRRVIKHETMPQDSDRQTLMFSATFPEDIQRLAGEFLTNYIFVTIGIVGGACSDVVQTIYEVKKSAKRTKLSEILNESSEGVLVFVETKRSADFLASFFSESNFPTTSIHGDRLQSQREQALADFRSGKMKVLIATSVAARGLDIKHISHVVNYDLPTNIDDYVHRIGRTGRVGNSGRSTSFFCSETDTSMAAPLVRILEGAGQEVPDFLRSYASSGDCGSGGSYSNVGFGGRDVRKGKMAESSGPAALEEDEEWD